MCFGLSLRLISHVLMKNYSCKRQAKINGQKRMNTSQEYLMPAICLRMKRTTPKMFPVINDRSSLLPSQPALELSTTTIIIIIRSTRHSLVGTLKQNIFICRTLFFITMWFHDIFFSRHTTYSFIVFKKKNFVKPHRDKNLKCDFRKDSIFKRRLALLLLPESRPVFRPFNYINYIFFPHLIFR